MAQRRERARVAVDHAEMRQIRDDRLRVLRGEFVRDIAHAAQFERHRREARRNRKAVREFLTQITPRRCARFIERLAARHVRQQLRPLPR